MIKQSELVHNSKFSNQDQRFLDNVLNADEAIAIAKELEQSNDLEILTECLQYYTHAANQGRKYIARMRMPQIAFRCASLVFDQGLKAFEDDDIPTAIYCFKSTLGFAPLPTAAFMLGLIYEKGMNGSENKDKALTYYSLAAELGHADSQLKLEYLKKKDTSTKIVSYGSLSDDEPLSISPFSEEKKKEIRPSQPNLTTEQLYYLARDTLTKKDGDLQFAALHLINAIEKQNATTMFGGFLMSKHGQATDILFTSPSTLELYHHALSIRKYPDVMNNLGILTILGLGETLDHGKGLEYLMKAANAGSVIAAINLDHIRSAKLISLSKDQEKAIHSITTSFREKIPTKDLHNVSASDLYHRAMFFKSQKIHQKQMTSLLELAAERDYAPAIRECGTLYKNICDCEDNAKAATEHYQLAAEFGDDKAWLDLSKLASTTAAKQEDPTEKEALLVQANACLGQAISLGYISAISKAGKLMAKKNNPEAVVLLIHAASEGDEHALLKLSDLYRSGHLVKKDLKTAYTYFLFASRMNPSLEEKLNIIANEVALEQWELGKRYLQGKHFKEATTCFHKAVSYGAHAEAAFKLGKIYEHGHGIDVPNLEKALGFYVFAYESGKKEKAVENKITSLVKKLQKPLTTGQKAGLAGATILSIFAIGGGVALTVLTGGVALPFVGSVVASAGIAGTLETSGLIYEGKPITLEMYATAVAVGAVEGAVLGAIAPMGKLAKGGSLIAKIAVKGGAGALGSVVCGLSSELLQAAFVEEGKKLETLRNRLGSIDALKRIGSQAASGFVIGGAGKLASRGLKNVGIPKFTKLEKNSAAKKIEQGARRGAAMTITEFGRDVVFNVTSEKGQKFLEDKWKNPTIALKIIAARSAAGAGGVLINQLVQSCTQELEAKIQNSLTKSDQLSLPANPSTPLEKLKQEKLFLTYNANQSTATMAIRMGAGAFANASTFALRTTLVHEAKGTDHSLHLGQVVFQGVVHGAVQGAEQGGRIIKAQQERLTQVKQAYKEQKEKAREEEQQRLEAERKAAEEQRRLESERKEAEQLRLEAERKEVEEQKRLEIQRKTEEDRKNRLEIQRKAEEEQKRVEAAKKANIDRQIKLESERQATEEQKRLDKEAEEHKQKLVAEQRAEENYRKLEADRKAAEDKRRLEAEQKAAEEKQRLEAEKAAAQRQASTKKRNKKRRSKIGFNAPKMPDLQKVGKNIGKGLEKAVNSIPQGIEKGINVLHKGADDVMQPIQQIADQALEPVAKGMEKIVDAVEEGIESGQKLGEEVGQDILNHGIQMTKDISEATRPIAQAVEDIGKPIIEAVIEVPGAVIEHGIRIGADIAGNVGDHETARKWKKGADTLHKQNENAVDMMMEEGGKIVTAKNAAQIGAQAIAGPAGGLAVKALQGEKLDKKAIAANLIGGVVGGQVGKGVMQSSGNALLSNAASKGVGNGFGYVANQMLHREEVDPSTFTKKIASGAVGGVIQSGGAEHLGDAGASMAQNAGTQLIEKGKIDGKEVVRAGMETTFTKLVEQALESLLDPAQNGTQSPPVPQPPLPDALTNELEEQSVVPLPNQDAEVPAQSGRNSIKQPSPFESQPELLIRDKQEIPDTNPHFPNGLSAEDMPLENKHGDHHPNPHPYMKSTHPNTNKFFTPKAPSSKVPSIIDGVGVAIEMIEMHKNMQDSKDRFDLHHFGPEEPKYPRLFSPEGLRDQEQKDLKMAKEKKLEVQGRWQARFDQLKVINGEDYSNDLNNIMRKPPAERIKFEEVVDKYIAENYDNRNAVLSQPGRNSIKQPSPSELQPELRIRGKQEIPDYPPDNSVLEKATDAIDKVTTYGQGKMVDKLDKINKVAKIVDCATTEDRHKQSSIAGDLIEGEAASIVAKALEVVVKIPASTAGIAASLLIGSDSVGDATLKPDSKPLYSPDKPLVYPTEQKRHASDFFPKNPKKPTIIRESTEEEKMQVERHFHSK